MRRVPLALAIVAALTVGCTLGEPGSVPPPQRTIDSASTPPPPREASPPTPSFPEANYSLALAGLPNVTEQGSPFNFTLYVDGTAAGSSDIILARIARTPQTQPSEQTYPGMCPRSHASGVPGTFPLTCTVNDLGTAYVRGMMRIMTNAWWSPEASILVRVPVGSFTITSPNVSTTPQTIPGSPVGTRSIFTTPAKAGTTYSVTLRVNGTTEEIASAQLRWANQTSTLAAASEYPNECPASPEAPVPGDLTATCSFPRTGTTYVRARLMIQVGQTSHEAWSDEWVLTVT